jgi:hypothetical protein
MAVNVVITSVIPGLEMGEKLTFIEEDPVDIDEADEELDVF